MGVDSCSDRKVPVVRAGRMTADGQIHLILMLDIFRHEVLKAFGGRRPHYILKSPGNTEQQNVRRGGNCSCKNRYY